MKCKWIDLKEKLPPEQRIVLLYVPKRKMPFMAYLYNGKWVSRYNEVEYFESTYWMELPDAPKQK